MTLYNDVLNELQYYILDENNIRKSIEMKFKYIPNNNKPNNIKHASLSKPASNIFIPREKDTLFWCFYILKNGEVKYETTNNKNDVIATRLKIDYIEKIRNEKQTIKTYKFDTINNIESNLSNDKTLNVKTFLSLCAIENINVLIVNNKTYYKLLMNDTPDIYIVYCLYNGNKSYERRYGFEIGTHHAINNIETTLYRVENIDKPIKPITAYKVQDLVDISNKLAIETSNAQTGKVKSKKDLYQEIVQYF